MEHSSLSTFDDATFAKYSFVHISSMKGRHKIQNDGSFIVSFVHKNDAICCIEIVIVLSNYHWCLKYYLLTTSSAEWSCSEIRTPGKARTVETNYCKENDGSAVYHVSRFRVFMVICCPSQPMCVASPTVFDAEFSSCRLHKSAPAKNTIAPVHLND